jgi:hypothetical protein
MNLPDDDTTCIKQEMPHGDSDGSFATASTLAMSDDIKWRRRGYGYTGS